VGCDRIHVGRGCVDRPGLSARFGYLQAIPGREDVVLYIVALLFTGAGLVSLHVLQRASYSLFGEAFFCFTLVAIAGRILGAVVFLAGSTALERVSWPLTLGMLVGFVLYGAATLRARVLPRWYGCSHSCYAGVAAPVGVRNRVVRPFPGGVGLRVVVAQGSRYRAALARAVNSHEKALSRREPGVVSSVGQSGSI
jgi:hypothetical protein